MLNTNVNYVCSGLAAPIIPVRTSVAKLHEGSASETGFSVQQDGLEQSFAQILSITISVNDRQIRLDREDGELDGQAIPVFAGDKVQVEHLEFLSTTSGGVFAAEGYIVKPQEGIHQILDFNDGRFSLIDELFILNSGSMGSIDGLIGSWNVRPGWTELRINLMYYTLERTHIAASVEIPLAIH